MTPLLLALDFGGTKLAAAATWGGQNSWLAHRQADSPQGAGGQRQYQLMLELAHQLLDEAGQMPEAIGVSFGGPVDGPAGLVRHSTHVPGWEVVPLVEWLGAEFRAPVAMDNDGKVAALGEFQYGAGQGCGTLLYVTVSTGIGGGWILNGQPFDGADGMAGEIGHTLVQPNGLPCSCGRRGCLEAEASGLGIAARSRDYVAKGGSRAEQLLTMAGDDPEKITAKLVSRAAAGGDSLSQKILDESAERLGLGLSNVLNLINPERIILGGGVTKSGERWWQIVRRVARANTLPDITVDIVPAALGDDAPLWGAVALAEGVLKKSQR